MHKDRRESQKVKVNIDKSNEDEDSIESEQKTQLICLKQETQVPTKGKDLVRNMLAKVLQLFGFK